eukprot:scaffold313647_cov31-Tisochrysis_lutea.AAC.3
MPIYSKLAACLMGAAHCSLACSQCCCVFLKGQPPASAGVAPSVRPPPIAHPCPHAPTHNPLGRTT